MFQLFVLVERLFFVSIRLFFQGALAKRYATLEILPLLYVQHVHFQILHIVLTPHLRVRSNHFLFVHAPSDNYP